MNTSNKEQVINVKFYVYNEKIYVFSQNRCGFINVFEIIHKNMEWTLLLISCLETNSETYSRFSFINQFIYCPLLEHTGLKIITFSFQNHSFEKEILEVDFKKDQPEMKLENVGLIMTISDVLIEDKYLILGYETASNFR